MGGLLPQESREFSCVCKYVRAPYFLMFCLEYQELLFPWNVREKNFQFSWSCFGWMGYDVC